LARVCQVWMLLPLLRDPEMLEDCASKDGVWCNCSIFACSCSGADRRQLAAGHSAWFALVRFGPVASANAAQSLTPNCGGLGHLDHFAQRFYFSQALDQACHVSRWLSCLHSCSSGSDRSLVHFTLFKAASASSSPTQLVRWSVALVRRQPHGFRKTGASLQGPRFGVIAPYPSIFYLVVLGRCEVVHSAGEKIIRAFGI
jgi:hypothetical protein